MSRKKPESPDERTALDVLQVCLEETRAIAALIHASFRSKDEYDAVEVREAAETLSLTLVGKMSTAQEYLEILRDAHIAREEAEEAKAA